MDETGRVISTVREIARVKNLATKAKGRHSVGGMVSKLDAVQMAVAAGIPTTIINGRHPERIKSAVKGKALGTRFVIRDGA